jgi:HSP20 family molecular chaperone IbpA
MPGRIVDLLWTDEEYFRDVSGSKKISNAGKFPRCDQWCDDAGLHMAFALAGYSPSDISVSASSNQIFISGGTTKAGSEDPPTKEQQVEVDEYPAKEPKKIVQQGMIVRGIARRSFRVKFYINPYFNTSKTMAKMENGLLEVIIPRGDISKSVNIKIEEF